MLVPDPHGEPERTSDQPSEGQRNDTTPLTRDNSRIDHGQAPGSSGSEPAATPEDATRPAFQQPAPVGPPPPAQPASPPPGYQQSGYQHTAQQPPVQQPPAQPPPPESGGQESSGASAAGWLLRGLGLVAVSVVSGLIWLALKPDGPESDPGQAQQGPQTQHDFRLEGKDQRFEGCQEVSTEQIASYLSQHPCEHLTRALYTTTLPDGERVLTSVVTVRMQDAVSAKVLNDKTKADNTGNIKDLADDNETLPKSFPSLTGDRGYWSEQQDRLVVVGDSAYFSSPKREDPRLTDVTRDALQLGWPQDREPT